MAHYFARNSDYEKAKGNLYDFVMDMGKRSLEYKCKITLLEPGSIEHIIPFQKHISFTYLTIEEVINALTACINLNQNLYKWHFAVYIFIMQNNSVVELQNAFDANEILLCIENLVFKDDEWDYDNWFAFDQFSLRGNNWFEGIGSLLAENNLDYTYNYVTNNKKIQGSYLEKVILDVISVAEQDGVRLGRIRCMRLKPKTCLTLHKDFEEFRYHIPLKTCFKSFFIENDCIYRMPHIGKLYRFKTNSFHMAVNASLEER